MNDHLALIEGFITVNIGRAIPDVRLVTLDDWDDTVDVLHAPFGYLPPGFEEGDRDMSVSLCPELIAEQVAHIDDPDTVFEYLLAVEQHICLHVIHQGSRPAGALEQFIIQLSRDTAPNATHRAEAIQLRALENA